MYSQPPKAFKSALKFGSEELGIFRSVNFEALDVGKLVWQNQTIPGLGRDPPLFPVLLVPFGKLKAELALEMSGSR